MNLNKIYGIGHDGNDILSITLGKHFTEQMSDLSDAVEVFSHNNPNFGVSNAKDVPKNDIKTDNDNYTLQGRVSNDNSIWRNFISRFTPKPTGFAAPMMEDFGSEHIFTPDEIGNLSSEQYNKYENQIMTQLRDGKINNQNDNDFSGYQNSVMGNSKIFSREDIGQMSTDEYSQNEAAIFAQMNSIGIPTNSELSHAGGTIYVEPYVRSDGTPVRGYYRSV